MSITLPTAFGRQSREFSRAKYIGVYTCKSPTAFVIFVCQAREFSRTKYISARIYAKRIAREQSVHVPMQLIAAAALSRGKTRRQKFPLKFLARIREARFQSIRHPSPNLSLIALSQTSDECHIDFTKIKFNRFA